MPYHRGPIPYHVHSVNIMNYKLQRRAHSSQCVSNKLQQFDFEGQYIEEETHCPFAGTNRMSFLRDKWNALLGDKWNVLLEGQM